MKVTYPIMEQFYTLQGEGAFAGVAAYFIRIGGCDVGCHWCDVKESWEAENHPTKTIEQIISQIPAQADRIVITGGEPLQYDLNPLTAELKSKNYKLHLETSGAFPFSGDFDWICLSPKKRMEPKSEIYQQAHELKAIIYNKSDFAFALKHAEDVNESCKLYLQPEWGKRKEMEGQIIDFIKENPRWQLSVQSHKYLEIP